MRQALKRLDQVEERGDMLGSASRRTLGSKGGRPAVITEAQQQAIANKAMELKKDLIAPTPEKIRICLPRLSTNRNTKEPISDWKIREVFKTMCYDDESLLTF